MVDEAAHHSRVYTMCGLEKLGLDQNWLERNFSALLLKTLVVGRRQQSESIGVAFYMEIGGSMMNRLTLFWSVPLLWYT